MVLDLSKNKSVYLSSKYQAQQKETEIRKVLDLPHMDFQGSFVKSLENHWEYGFKHTLQFDTNSVCT